jgi:hypothetical protein
LHRKDPRPSWDEETYERRNLPLPGGEAYGRRLGTSPESQSGLARGEAYPVRESPVSPGNAHGGCAAEIHYHRLAEGIITMAGAGMTDKTGWTSPIGAVRQAE